MWAFDRGLAPPGYRPSSLRDWIDWRPCLLPGAGAARIAFGVPAGRWVLTAAIIGDETLRV
jgi:hypothetical protein